MKFTFHTLLIALILFFSACTEPEETYITISDETAAEQVSAIIYTDIEGLAGDMDHLIQYSVSENARSVCGVVSDTTITHTYTNDIISWNYEGNYSYGIDCNRDASSAFFVNVSSTSDYEDANIMTMGSANGDLTVTGLSSNKYTVSGTMSSTSSLDQKDDDQNSFTSTASVTFLSLITNKGLGEFSGGAIAISSEGTNEEGAYFFNATVYFSTDGTATAIINDKTWYLINMETWELTKLSKGS